MSGSPARTLLRSASIRAADPCSGRRPRFVGEHLHNAPVVALRYVGQLTLLVLCRPSAFICANLERAKVVQRARTRFKLAILDAVGIRDAPRRRESSIAARKVDLHL